MKSEIGYCKYCGDSRMIEIPDSYSQERINEEVTKKCDCPEATAAVRIEEMTAHTEYQLKEILKEHQNILELSIRMVEPLAKNTISKYSIGFGSFTLNMKRKPEKISISLKYTKEEKRE